MLHLNLRFILWLILGETRKTARANRGEEEPKVAETRD